MSEFEFQEMFPHGEDTTPYRKLSSDHVATAEFGGRNVLTVEPEALTLLTARLVHPDHESRDLLALVDHGRPGGLPQGHLRHDEDGRKQNQMNDVEELILNSLQQVEGSEDNHPKCQDNDALYILRGQQEADLTQYELRETDRNCDCMNGTFDESNNSDP